MENSVQVLLLFSFLFRSFEFTAILGTELVRTVGAAQRFIGLFPKPLGMKDDAKFPNNKDRQRQRKKAQRVKSAYEDNRREHHKVIPIEYAAGGAAAVAHDKAEGAPYQHADKVAYIKGNRNQQQSGFMQHIKEVQQTDDRNKRNPNKHYLVGGLGGGTDVFLNGLLVYLLRNGMSSSAQRAPTRSSMSTRWRLWAMSTSQPTTVP